MSPGAAGRRGISGAAWPLLLAAFLLYFPGLGNHDLWNPNEPVFAEGAREMQERGEWLLPYVNDQIYLDKPILYFWSIRAAALLDGEVTPRAARLPSAVAALLTVALVYGFGARAFGRSAGALAGWVLATTPIFVWEARFAQMDPLLTMFCFGSLAAFHRAREGRAMPWLALSGALAGLAFLTKGPVALALPGGAALLVLILERDVRFLLRPAWLAGAAAFLACGAPWFVWLWLSGNREWLEEFFLRQNMARFLDPFDHARPWYYYGQRFLTDLFPWCLFLPLALTARPRRADGERAGRAWRLCAVYLAVVLLFFSASGAKRGVYILPLYPAFALLVGQALDRKLREARPAPGVRLAAGIAGAILAVAGSAAIVLVARRHPEFLTPGAAFGGTLAATGLLAVAAAWRAAPRRAVGVLAAGMALTYVVGSHWVMPRVDSMKSARPFSEAVLDHAGADAPLASFRFWKWRSEYAFYTRRTMPNLEGWDEVERYFSDPAPVYLLVDEEYRAALETEVDAPHHRLLTDQIGAGTMHLYSNFPPQ